MYSVGKIIANARKKNNLLQPDLAKLLQQRGFDITHKAISKWETGNSEPSVTMFMEICRILNITNIYEEYFGENPSDPLSKLNQEGKAKALEYIELLDISGKYQKQPAELLPYSRSLRLFDMPASAGPGNFLDSSNYEMISVGNEVPHHADYGIRISGDSMLPRFVSGQIVWVAQQDTLESGEIGIFFLDGNVYIKKFKQSPKEAQLISLNTSYKPIPILSESSFKILGKVVG